MIEPGQKWKFCANFIAKGTILKIKRRLSDKEIYGIKDEWFLVYDSWYRRTPNKGHIKFSAGYIYCNYEPCNIKLLAKFDRLRLLNVISY